MLAYKFELHSIERNNHVCIWLFADGESDVARLQDVIHTNHVQLHSPFSRQWSTHNAVLKWLIVLNCPISRRWSYSWPISAELRRRLWLVRFRSLIDVYRNSPSHLLFVLSSAFPWKWRWIWIFNCLQSLCSKLLASYS